MIVGSILNGDSPQDSTADYSRISDAEDTESRGSQPSIPDISHRQPINNFLNDAPSQTVDRRHGSNDSQDSGFPQFSQKYIGTGEHRAMGFKSLYGNADDDDVDVDAEVELIDRELAEASLNEIEEQESSKEASSGNVGARKKEQNDKPINRKAFLSGELEKVQKLKAEKRKPKRYIESPIWVQDGIPPSQQENHGYSIDAGKTSASGNLQAQDSVAATSNSVFKRDSMISTDLKCSITGALPPQSTVRTIAEWLYANFMKMSLESRKYVELEIKFGTIINKMSGSRIDIGVSTECIFSKMSKTRFEMGVHEAGWKEMKDFLNELEKKYVESVRRDQSKLRRKFSVTESNNTDYIFQITERNEKPKRIRISKDNSLNPPGYVAISKQRLSDLYIHNPSSMYDLRLSLSLELPVEDESIDPIMKKYKPLLQRGKNRASYSHAPTVTRFDYTEVSVPRATKNKSGCAVTENEKSYELELEIDTFQIFQGFDRVRDGSDTIRFEELVEMFLNNARCLNNHVTKFASN